MVTVELRPPLEDELKVTNCIVGTFRESLYLLCQRTIHFNDLRRGGEKEGGRGEGGEEEGEGGDVEGKGEGRERGGEGGREGEKWTERGRGEEGGKGNEREREKKRGRIKTNKQPTV